MGIVKQKQITWIIFLLIGVGYFNIMSHWEINYFPKSLIALMPIQILSVFYITCIRWNRH
jgi:hypothetical protein